MDGCGETEYRVENLDDQDEIFCLESEFRERRVRRASPAVAGARSLSSSLFPTCYPCSKLNDTIEAALTKISALEPALGPIKSQ